jgi:hypothetical protein
VSKARHITRERQFDQLTLGIVLVHVAAGVAGEFAGSSIKEPLFARRESFLDAARWMARDDF